MTNSINVDSTKNIGLIVPTLPNIDSLNDAVVLKQDTLIPINNSQLIYEVFIPGFTYYSKGPIWIDKIEIEELNGELLYNNANPNGVNKITFFKQNENLNALTGLHFKKINNSELINQNEYSEYLTTEGIYGANQNSFIDIIEETNSNSILKHYLTVYPNYSEENNLNQNLNEHTGLCYLKTDDINKEFFIKYKLYSKLSNNLYILVYEDVQKYYPFGINIEGEITFSCDKSEDIFKQIYDNNYPLEKNYSIRLNENESIPVIRINGDIYKAEWKDDSYISSDKISPDIKIYVYPQWECNNKNTINKVFDPNYYVADKSGNATVIISAKKVENEGIAPADKDLPKIFNDQALSYQRQYFNQFTHPILKYNASELIKRGILSTQLLAYNFESNKKDWYNENLYTNKFYNMKSDNTLEFQEEFGKRLNVCGAANKNSNRTFNINTQFNVNLSDRIYKWGSLYAAESFGDRDKYFSDGGYMKFLINLVSNSTGFGYRFVSYPSLNFNFSKIYNYNFLKNYNKNSYLYKKTPTIDIINNSDLSSRYICAIRYPDNYNSITINVTENITNLPEKKEILINKEGKTISEAKIITNNNILFERPHGEIQVPLSSSGDYNFNTTYNVSGRLQHPNPLNGWFYAPNAKLFYDVQNLSFSNESDYSIISQFELNKEMINTSTKEIQTIPVAFNGSQFVLTNLKLDNNNIPEPIFELIENTYNEFPFESSLKNINNKINYAKSFSYKISSLKKDMIYVLQVNYLRWHPNISKDITISVDLAGIEICKNSKNDTFAFYVKDNNFNNDIIINIKSNTSENIIYSAGLYQLDETCNEYKIIKESVNSINYNQKIINIDNVENHIFVPSVFCFSEYGKTCYQKTYNYTHLPRQPYLKVLGWYEVNNNNDDVQAINSEHPYYKYSNNKLFKTLKDDGKIQALRF